MTNGMLPTMEFLTPKERTVFRKLSSPNKIQDYLDTLAINHEKQGETCYSPRLVLRKRKAHCLEAALLAAAALAYHGRPALLLNLRTVPRDDDHAVALYKENGLWGAIGKTNHAALRFRDPVHRTLRELVLSYFHEYYLNDNGQKTLRSFSKPFSLARFRKEWVASEKPLWHIAHALRDSSHEAILPEGQVRHLRPADRFERKIGRIVEWPYQNPRT